MSQFLRVILLLSCLNVSFIILYSTNFIQIKNCLRRNHPKKIILFMPWGGPLAKYLVFEMISNCVYLFILPIPLVKQLVRFVIWGGSLYFKVNTTNILLFIATLDIAKKNQFWHSRTTLIPKCYYDFLKIIFGGEPI